MRLAFVPPASLIEQHAAGDAAVEHERQGEVAAGAAALAHQLDDDRADDRGDDGAGQRERVLRHQPGPAADEPAERDTGEGDVADAVAQERHPALDEERADDRCRRADQHGGDERALHEGRAEQLDHLVPRGHGFTSTDSDGPVRGGSGSGCACVWSCHSPACSPRAGGGGPSCATRPCRSTTARSMRGANGPSSCRITTTVVPASCRRLTVSTNVACVGMSMPGGGLVEHQQLGLPDQGAGDEHPLLLPAGHLVHALGRAVGQADVGQRREDTALVPAGRSQGATVQQAGGHHLGGRRRDAGGGGQPLGHVPDPVPRGGRAERRAEQPDVARGTRHHAEQRTYEGRLAGAVGAEQGEHLARGTARSMPSRIGWPPSVTPRPVASITGVLTSRTMPCAARRGSLRRSRSSRRRVDQTLDRVEHALSTPRSAASVCATLGLTRLSKKIVLTSASRTIAETRRRAVRVTARPPGRCPRCPPAPGRSGPRDSRTRRAR